jgi:hypothetical protein
MISGLRGALGRPLARGHPRVTLGELRDGATALAHPDPGRAARQLERVLRGRRQASLAAAVSRWADGLSELGQARPGSSAPVAP